MKSRKCIFFTVPSYFDCDTQPSCRRSFAVGKERALLRYLRGEAHGGCHRGTSLAVFVVPAQQSCLQILTVSLDTVHRPPHSLGDCKVKGIIVIIYCDFPQMQKLEFPQAIGKRGPEPLALYLHRNF